MPVDPAAGEPRNQHAGQRERDGQQPQFIALAPMARIAAIGNAVRVMRSRPPRCPARSTATGNRGAPTDRA